jgi:hypothetical protein
MQTYPERVRERILPLSIAKTLPKAFDEWQCTGNVVDHGEPYERCELCGHEDLRYHFEIANKHTCETLRVGSRCILKFIAVYEGDRKLSPKDAKKKLDGLIEQMRVESCIKAMKDLVWAEKSESDILENALADYRKNKKLTPRQASEVFRRFRHNRIDHEPSFFNITLKGQMEDLKNMETSCVHLLWPALTPCQRKRAAALGHAPPPSEPIPNWMRPFIITGGGLQRGL